MTDNLPHHYHEWRRETQVMSEGPNCLYFLEDNKCISEELYSFEIVLHFSNLHFIIRYFLINEGSFSIRIYQPKTTIGNSETIWKLPIKTLDRE